MHRRPARSAPLFRLLAGALATSRGTLLPFLGLRRIVRIALIDDVERDGRDDHHERDEHREELEQEHGPLYEVQSRLVICDL
jgi:hypothetical protein